MLSHWPQLRDAERRMKRSARRVVPRSAVLQETPLVEGALRQPWVARRWVASSAMRSDKRQIDAAERFVLTRVPRKPAALASR
jgi:hypothetical protein